MHRDTYNIINISKCLALFVCIAALPLYSSAAADDGAEIVRRAIAHWRGDTSRIKSEMVVTRPDWSRKSAFVGWTSGMDQSLVRFVEPAKDAGNATLAIEDDTWTFNPKVNKVIKIPPSMKTQSWMGSDFSYQDLSREDDILKQYDHRLIAEEVHEGKKVFVVESLPHENAPVVWGKEILSIREDNIVIKHEFYDQDMKLVKRLAAQEIGELGGRIFPTKMRMEKIEEPGEWTEVRYIEGEFDLDIPRRMFTLSNLQNPR